MQLDEFFKYKNKLMEDLLTNEKIIKLVDENATLDTAVNLLSYKKIIPMEYVPETANHGATYICFDVDIQESIDRTYLLPTIFIWVFSHKSELRLPQGGIRPDTLCSEIAKSINGSRYYGLGELELHSVKRFSPAIDYQGKVMVFYTKEFNRVRFGQGSEKDMPTNRLTGV